MLNAYEVSWAFTRNSTPRAYDTITLVVYFVTLAHKDSATIARAHWLESAI